MSIADLTKWHYVEAEDVWVTPRGRSNFVALARKFKNKKSTRKDDEGQYAVSLILPPTVDMKPINKAVNDIAKSNGGSGVDLFVPGKSKGIKSPISKADEKLADVTSKGEAVDLEGWKMLRANAFSRRPAVRLADGTMVDEDDLAVEAYSGRWMRLMVRPAWYDNESKGVKFWLEGVQLLRHDDAIGGAGTGSTGEAFGAVDDEEDEEMPF